MKKKQQFKCPKCSAKYWRWDALQRHIRKEHFSEFVSYFSLLQRPEQWGYRYDNEKDVREFKKSPSDLALQMAFLAHIWQELINIKEELQKTRTLK
jgi:uncharacterized C2H2 Zn-finger protein